MGQNNSLDRRSDGRPYPYNPPPGNNPELFLLEQETRRERTGSFGSSRKKDRYVLNKQEKYSLERHRPSSESERWLSSKDAAKLRKLANNNTANNKKNNQEVSTNQGSGNSRDLYELSALRSSPGQSNKTELLIIDTDTAGGNGNKADKGKGKKEGGKKGRSGSFSFRDKSKDKQQDKEKQKDKGKDKEVVSKSVSTRENTTDGQSTQNVTVVPPTDTNQHQHLLRIKRGREKIQVLQHHQLQQQQQQQIQQQQQQPQHQKDEGVTEKGKLSKQDKDNERAALRRLEQYRRKKAAMVSHPASREPPQPPHRHPRTSQSRESSQSPYSHPQTSQPPSHPQNSQPSRTQAKGSKTQQNNSVHVSSSNGHVNDRRSWTEGTQGYGRPVRVIPIQPIVTNGAGGHPGVQQQHPGVQGVPPLTPVHGPVPAPVSMPNPWGRPQHHRHHRSASETSTSQHQHHQQHLHMVPPPPPPQDYQQEYLVPQVSQETYKVPPPQDKVPQVSQETYKVPPPQDKVPQVSQETYKVPPPQDKVPQVSQETYKVPLKQGHVTPPQVNHQAYQVPPNNTRVLEAVENGADLVPPPVGKSTATADTLVVVRVQQEQEEQGVSTATSTPGTLSNRESPSHVQQASLSTPSIGSSQQQQASLSASSSGSSSRSSSRTGTDTPTGISPTSVSPTSVSPTSVSPTDVSPTDVSPTAICAPPPCTSAAVVEESRQKAVNDLLYAFVPVHRSTVSLPDQNRNKTTKSTSSLSKRTTNQPDVVTNSVPALPTGTSEEITRLEALCETRTKQLNIARMQLRTSAQGFDAMTVLVKYLTEELDAFSCPEVTAKLKAVKGQLAEAEQQIDVLAKDKASLEKSLVDLKKQHAAKVTAVKDAHREELQKLQDRLNTEREQELEKVVEKYTLEVTTLKSFLEKNISDMKTKHEKTLQDHKDKHDKDVEALKEEHGTRTKDLQKQHERRLEEITRTFEHIKLTLSEKVDMLRGECEEMRSREAHLEERTQREADSRIHMALAQYKHLPAEIESLKAVMEMRNQELHELRHKKLELEKQLEEIPVARDKIISLQQKVENLEAVIQLKADYEKQLTEKHQILLRKFDKESKANKRLSMDNEELAWRLQNSAESPDLLRRSISHSPTRASPADPTPEVVRRRRSPACSMPTSPRNQTEFDNSPVGSLQSPPKSNLKRSGTYDLLNKDPEESDMKQSDV